MFRGNLTLLEVPTAWGARLAVPFEGLMPPAVDVDTAQLSVALFAMAVGIAHLLPSYLNLEYPALREVVDGYWGIGLSLNKSMSEVTTSTDLMA